MELVSDIVGCPAALEFLPSRRHDVNDIVLDISKLSSFIDYAPLELGEGLRLTLQEMRASALASGNATPGPQVIRLRADDAPPRHDAAIP